MRRALIFGGAIALLVGLAFLVARPSAPDVATTPYAGVRGASRAQAAGLEIFYRREGREHVVEPATVLRAGDALRFVVRGERPRYVEVRVRDGTAEPAIVYPPPAVGAVGAVGPVAPKQSLPVTPVVNGSGAKVVVTALFADQPRPPGAPPDADTEEVTIAIAKE